MMPIVTIAIYCIVILVWNYKITLQYVTRIRQIHSGYVQIIRHTAVF